MVLVCCKINEVFLISFCRVKHIEICFFLACNDAACFDPSYSIPPVPNASGQVDRIYFPRSLSVTGKNYSPVHLYNNKIGVIHLAGYKWSTESLFWEMMRMFRNKALSITLLLLPLSNPFSHFFFFFLMLYLKK